MGGADQAAGASARIAEGIILAADNMDAVASAALTAATAIIGALAGRAMIGAGVQILSTAKALGEFVRIARAAQGLGGLGPAFASLGAQAGIIGLVIGGAAALALGHFANQAIETKLRTERVNEVLEAMGLSGKTAAEGLNEAATAQERLSTAKGIADAQQKLKDLTESGEDAAATFDNLTRTVEDMTQKVRDGLIEAADAEAAAKAEAAGLTKGFKEQKVSVETLNARLTELATKFPNMASWIDQVLAAADAMNNLATATGRANSEVQSIGVIKVDPIRALEDRDVTGDAIGTGNKWINEQQRRIALTKDQRDLEDEIVRLRKDAGDGFVSDPQLATLAKSNLARQASERKTGKGSKTDAFGDAATTMQQRIDNLVAETALISTLNPLINDYGYAVEKSRAQQELENAATKAGLALTPERAAQIATLSEGYARATVAAQQLDEAQNATIAQMETLRDASRQALDTIIDGFLEGKSAGEIFGNVLKDISKQLISMGMNGLFGNGQGANPFGFIGKALGFDDGGYTGPGGKKQPAGVVHKGEVVWSQRDVSRHGGPATVDAMRLGKRGYDTGGIVGGRFPMMAMPTLPQTATALPALSMQVEINAPGADVAGLMAVRDELRKLKAAVPSMAKKTYQDMRKYGQVKR